MSESTSFLGGAAFAGLAALVLLKGGISIGAPNTGVSPSMPNTSLSPTMPNQPIQVIASPMPTVSPSPEQQSEEEAKKIEELKALVDQQKTDNEKLKSQLQDLHEKLEVINAQNKASAALANANVNQSLSNNDPLSNPVLTGLLWAFGGVALTLGGGIVLVGLFVLVARQQNQQPTRTVEVIHTAHEVPAYLPQRRRPPMLPARRVVKRANLVE
jgi:uncharacterized coiled-coil protein SlyX